jgi:hypothetical protein
MKNWVGLKVKLGGFWFIKIMANVGILIKVYFE